ncbi:MAG: hypothetical protein QHH80_09445 [Anaerolineae bacterium]|nr:hypothetical protein [Anaerolineae bacterium]
MPRHANKRPCAVEGCRAWAMRGETVCAAHRRAARARLSAPDGAVAQAPPLTADYTLDDLAAHAALALNRLEAWYGTHAADGDPRWMLAYVRQLYGCLARLAELWKQRSSLGEGELEAALNGALAELRNECAPDGSVAGDG